MIHIPTAGVRIRAAVIHIPTAGVRMLTARMLTTDR
jgi:hypothetical protein